MHRKNLYAFLGVVVLMLLITPRVAGGEGDKKTRSSFPSSLPRPRFLSTAPMAT